jgi:acyl-CoA dehydrogenase
MAENADNPSNPVPFSEPPYLCGLPSPYYSASHLEFQKACRKFLWDELLSQAAEWEKQGLVPEHVFGTFCRHGMLLPNLPAPLPVDWLKKLGIHDILGVKVEEWDYLHTGIYCDEVGFHPGRFLAPNLRADQGRSWLARVWPAPGRR